MSSVSLMSTTKSEWLKFRSVRSTIYNVVAIFVLSIGLGALINFAMASQYSKLRPAEQLTWDSLTFSLVGTFFAQFVIGVLGSMFITSEYSTGSIRTTFAAVPRRTLVVIAKVVVMGTTILVIGELISFIAFQIGQTIFASVDGVPYDSFSTPGALRGVFLAGVYLTLVGALGFSFGLLLRKTAASIIVFVVLLLVLPGLVQLLPASWGGPILRYLPSELGTGMMSINQAPGTFAPWACAAILLGYVIALISFGAYLLNRRDA